MTEKINTCKVCDEIINPFMSFGDMPIANGFLNESEYENEYFFKMQVAFCEKCGTFQLLDQPNPNQMFHGNYAFYSSQSEYMIKHFKKFANFVTDTYLKNKSSPFVIELGSNDGIMLNNFKQMGFDHLGIEPSKNVADVASSKGINTISEFFNLELANKIISNYGKADAIICANVMCHIPDINEIALGISKLLKKDGVLIFEDPYLGDMIDKTSYDQIYDEHVFIFSATSVSNAFGRYGLELIDVIPQETHGGSMRYVLGHKDIHDVNPSVAFLLKKENYQGLHLQSTFLKFKENCEKSKNDLLNLLKKLKFENKKVIGYGATSKSTTILNFCGIGPDLIEYISDTTPIKQNKFSPGVHIPVLPYENFKENLPEYVLLFAWNHATEIFEKEIKFISNGGKWIIFVPKVQII